MFEDIRAEYASAIRHDADHAIGIATRWVTAEWRMTGERSHEHVPRLTGFTSAGRIAGDPLGPAAHAAFVAGRIPVGSGAVMKLTINMPLMIYWQALGEALALCRPLGLDPARIMDLLSDTSGGPNVLKVRGPAVAEMLKGAGGGPVTFDIESAVKDLRTMLSEGKRRGLDLPLVEKTLACYEEAKRKVSGAAEVSAVSVYWANRASR